MDMHATAAVEVESVVESVEPKAETVKETTPKASYMADRYYKRGWLQPNHMTREERFPLIFNSVQELQPNAKRVLSFGCSTGEECQALAKRFPNAEIVGIDVDHHSIEQARRKNKNPNICFHDELSGLGKFDVVTALMVFFCMEEPIPKKAFASMLTKIDKHVNPGGLIAIYTSDHDPKEVLGDKYKDIRVWSREHNKNKKMYFNGYYRKKRWNWW
jgi:trans-aconitate methyltransferase